MRKLKKFRADTRDDSFTGGDHIHFQHILDFASERADFTEEENAHFDSCPACRFKVFYALKNVACQVVRTITAKAA